MPSGPVSKPLTAGLVFEGIGGFGLSCHLAGIKPLWSCEINEDARAVLAYRFPETPCHSDVKEIGFAERSRIQVPRVDILCGGFPCQDLSVAGKRAGLDGERSGLFWEFARLIEEGQPTWLVIENVPGLLSAGCKPPCEGGCVKAHGGAMGAVLGALGDLGYGVGYRVLDAQYAGVAQKRRRVLIVGHLGDPARAGEVLLEPEGSWWDLDPRRATGPGAPADPEERLVAGGAVAFDWQASAGANDKSWRGGPRSWIVKQGDYAGALSTTKVQAVASTSLTADEGLVTALTGGLGSGGPDAAHAQAGWLIPVSYSQTGTGWWNGPDDVTGTLVAREFKGPHSLVGMTAYRSYPESGQGADLVVKEIEQGESHPTLTANAGQYYGDRCVFVVDETNRTCIPERHLQRNGNAAIGPSAYRKAQKAHHPDDCERWEEADAVDTLSAHSTVAGSAVVNKMMVRRLLPLECERLQGFFDGWTDVPMPNGKRTSDSARYRMLGNALCVPVGYWVLSRLVAVDRRYRNLERGALLAPKTTDDHSRESSGAPLPEKKTLPPKLVKGRPKKGTQIIRGSAFNIPLADDSVDLIVTSPPFWSFRVYSDNGEEIPDQLGQEETSALYLERLLETMVEMRRVLKPTGSLFINVGDKYAGSGGHNNMGIGSRSTLRGNGHQGGVTTNGKPVKYLRDGPRRYRSSTTVRTGLGQVKDVARTSLMGLPWRFAIACEDELDFILRAEIIWDKPNGMPESVNSRVARGHEQWFHFSKDSGYYADLDPLRRAYSAATESRYKGRFLTNKRATLRDMAHAGIFRDVPEDGLILKTNPKGALPKSVWKVSTEPLTVPEDLKVEHFAAFPTEFPKRFIQGWCPPEGMVLDPFGGTGSTSLAAQELGRRSISLDLSFDYCRIASWRVTDPTQIKRMRKRITKGNSAEVKA